SAPSHVNRDGIAWPGANAGLASRNDVSTTASAAITTTLPAATHERRSLDPYARVTLDAGSQPRRPVVTRVRCGLSTAPKRGGGSANSHGPAAACGAAVSNSRSQQRVRDGKAEAEGLVPGARCRRSAALLDHPPCLVGAETTQRGRAQVPLRGE